MLHQYQSHYNRYQFGNNKVSQIENSMNSLSQGKTRNNENIKPKYYNSTNNSMLSSQQCNNNCHFKNAYINNNNVNTERIIPSSIPKHPFSNDKYINNSNPEYIQILKDKINSLQKENEILKDKYSQVTEMLSNERNNIPSVDNKINSHLNYQSLNELKQENEQFKQQINMLSQRIETLEEEKKQYEQNTKNSVTLDAIITSRKNEKMKEYEGFMSNSHTNNNLQRCGDSISYVSNTQRDMKKTKGIMNLKKKSSNLNKVKNANYICKKLPKTAINKKTKMKIQRPKSSIHNYSHNNTNELIKLRVPDKEYINDNNLIGKTNLDNIVGEKGMNEFYNINTEIQMIETNILKLSSEFNKLINHRYNDNEMMKDVLSKISNDLIGKTEQLLQLYKQQYSMLKIQFP